MPETFRTKVRTVGTSLGILLPKEILKKENVKVGEDVEVSIIKPMSKKMRAKLVSELFGIAKGSKLKFERDHKDRELG